MVAKRRGKMKITRDQNEEGRKFGGELRIPVTRREKSRVLVSLRRKDSAFRCGGQGERPLTMKPGGRSA